MRSVKTCCPACNYTFYFCSEPYSITDYTNRVYVSGAGCQNYFKKQCSSLSLSQTKTLVSAKCGTIANSCLLLDYTTHCGIVLPLCAIKWLDSVHLEWCIRTANSFLDPTEAFFPPVFPQLTIHLGDFRHNWEHETTCTKLDLFFDHEAPKNKDFIWEYIFISFAGLHKCQIFHFNFIDLKKNFFSISLKLIL